MKDQMKSMSSQAIQTAAFKILDAVQRIPPAEQAAGASLMFLLIMKKYNIGPRESMYMAERVLKDCLSEGRGEQVRAIQNYLDKEI